MAKIVHAIFPFNKGKGSAYLKKLIDKKIVASFSNGYRLVIARHGVNKRTLKKMLDGRI